MSDKGPVKQLARKATKCSRKTEPNRYELKSDEEDSDTGQSSSAGTGIRSTVPAKAQHSTSIRKSVRSERDAGLYSSQVGPSRRLGNNLHRSTEHTAHLAPPMGHKARNPAKPAVTLPSLFHTAPGAPTLRVSQRKAASTIFNRLQVVFTPMTEGPQKVPLVPRLPTPSAQKARSRMAASSMPARPVNMVTKAQKCAVKSQVGRKTAKASKLNEPDSDRDVQWGAASKENDWVDEDVEVVDTPPSRGNKISSGSTALFENRPPPDNLELRPPVQLVQAVIGCKFPTTPPGDGFRLPFLSRNLMKGFVGRCIEEDGASLHTKVDPPFTTTVAYRLAGTDCIHRASWDSSLCPLCPAYKYFRCQRTLKTHLAWDHDDVDVKWNTMSTGETHLELVLPAPAKVSARKTDMSLFNFVSFSRYARTLKDHTLNSCGSTGQARLPTPSMHGLDVGMQNLKVEDDEQTLPSEIVANQEIPSSESAKYQEVKALLDRKFGPTSKYPYLPAISLESEGPTVLYSCRPGGPKVYDLLGTLPLKPFGVLAWEIRVKEEEIFALPGIADGHKVMHALWNRWIFFNRSLFLGNQHEGVRAFITEYWRMIRLAAGWDVLRWWLLILCSGKHITGEDIADVVQHYEELCEEEYQKESEMMSE